MMFRQRPHETDPGRMYYDVTIMIRQTRGALAAERRLSEKLSVFAEVEVERSRTNEIGGSYRLNSGTAGLAYEF